MVIHRAIKYNDYFSDVSKPVIKIWTETVKYFDCGVHKCKTKHKSKSAAVSCRKKNLCFGPKKKVTLGMALSFEYLMANGVSLEEISDIYGFAQSTILIKIKRLEMLRGLGSLDRW